MDAGQVLVEDGCEASWGPQLASQNVLMGREDEEGSGKGKCINVSKVVKFFVEKTNPRSRVECM
jgi:hypothetical protein